MTSTSSDVTTAVTLPWQLNELSFTDAELSSPPLHSDMFLFLRRSDSDASLRVLVDSPMDSDVEGDQFPLSPKNSASPSETRHFSSFPSFPQTLSSDTSTPSSSNEHDQDSFFVRSLSELSCSNTSSAHGDQSSVKALLPTADAETVGGPHAANKQRKSSLYSRATTSILTSRPLSEVQAELDGAQPRAVNRPNVLTKRKSQRQSTSADKPTYRNSIITSLPPTAASVSSPTATGLSILPPFTSPAQNEPASVPADAREPQGHAAANSRLLVDRQTPFGVCSGPSDLDAIHDKSHRFLNPRSASKLSAQHPLTGNNNQNMESLIIIGNKHIPSRSTSPPSAYLRSAPQTAPGENFRTSRHYIEGTSEQHAFASSPTSRRSSQKLTKRRPSSVVDRGTSTFVIAETSPRPRRLSQKLTKSRPTSIGVYTPPPVSSAAILAELSPRPLSTLEIDIAKGISEPSLPLAQPANISPTKRRHRLSLHELAEQETMTEILSPPRSRSLFNLSSPQQKWKTRRINFLSSISTPSISQPEKGSSTGTDALASLAWTGVVVPVGTTPEPISPAVKTLEFSGEVKPREGMELKRGWTLAMAMTDDDVTDEVLVEELEKMRKGHVPDHQFHPSSAWMRQSRHGLSRSMSDVPSQSHDLNKAYTTDGHDLEDAATWHTARRALLCCRELVRTEKRYQEELRALMDGETTTRPPALMLTYLPALLHASEVLLKGISEDPSAWGVSATFIACEDELESAMVAWGGVAGQFFSKKRKSRSWRMSTTSQTSPASPPLPTPLQTPSPKPSTSFINGMAALPPTLAFLGDSTKEVDAEVKTPSENGHAVDDRSSDKCRRIDRKVTVRDLAIQPTQRVMRYVMLYRDLLAHTPHTSPSRALVERALQSAQRIAERCDQAQGNSAFLPRPRLTSTTSSTGSKLPFRALSSS